MSEPKDIVEMSDAEKLRSLADWFNTYDDIRGEPPDGEVQQDLRRIASRLEAADRDSATPAAATSPSPDPGIG